MLVIGRKRKYHKENLSSGGITVVGKRIENLSTLYIHVRPPECKTNH